MKEDETLIMTRLMSRMITTARPPSAGAVLFRGQSAAEAPEGRGAKGAPEGLEALQVL